ncbi:MAG TPA: S41 family peptidase [Candidatus Saccharimonadales bacterium]|nr:S41 family peptidase [Candidatus Saccharimonadales bacterium]
MKISSANLRITIIVIITFLVGYYVGVTNISFQWNNFQPDVEVSSKAPPPSVQFVDTNRMWLVLQKVEELYYDKTAINANKMLDGAISGMVNSLGDPYTLYLPPTQNTNFKQGLAGQFEGIGAELGMNGKSVIVISPIEGSPAIKAGIKPSDTILKVNGKDISGMDLTSIVNMIRGPKGTKVTLSVQHKGSSKIIDIPIVRNTITVKSLATWTKKVNDIPLINHKADALSQAGNDKIVYIRLSEFGDNTNSEWHQIALSINKQLQSDKSIKGVVLDLRNNPGGYLTDAIYIISEFVKSGTAVEQEDGNGKITSYPVNGKGMLTDVPVVVLINKGTASASEITSGGLRDNHRAELVGTNSFGKGIVQEAFDLGDGAGLHVTVAKWLTPDGTWVGNGKDGKGLTPDITVQLDPKNPTHDTQLEKAVEELVK